MMDKYLIFPSNWLKCVANSCEEDGIMEALIFQSDKKNASN